MRIMDDRIVAGASRAEAVAVGLEPGLPFGFQGELRQGLHRPVAHDGMPRGLVSPSFEPGLGIQTRRRGLAFPLRDNRRPGSAVAWGSAMRPRPPRRSSCRGCPGSPCGRPGTWPTRT